jgi:hypothetical protein
MYAVIILSSVSGVSRFVFSVGDKRKINDPYKIQPEDGNNKGQVSILSVGTAVTTLGARRYLHSMIIVLLCCITIMYSLLIHATKEQYSCHIIFSY